MAPRQRGCRISRSRLREMCKLRGQVLHYTELGCQSNTLGTTWRVKSWEMNDVRFHRISNAAIAFIDIGYIPSILFLLST